MTEHFIQTHKGKDHISSDDARTQWACLLGTGRSIVSGWEEEMALSVPSNNTLHIGRGYAIIDGGWYRISGSGEDRTISTGSIGMNRRDAIFLVYTRSTDDVEEMTLQIITGEPTAGTPKAPSNQHPGNILDGDAVVWIPFGEVPVSGLSVGKPVITLGKRKLSAPAQQCAECASTMILINRALADCRTAESRALETVRANERVLADIEQKQDEWAKKMLRLDEFESELADFALILSEQLESYMILGSALLVPAAWKTYDADARSISLKHTVQDGTALSLTKAPTVSKRQTAVQEQTDINTANIDFLLMMSEGE